MFSCYKQLYIHIPPGHFLDTFQKGDGGGARRRQSRRHNMPLRHTTKVSEMAQQVEGPATKPKDQSLIWGPHSESKGLTFANFPVTSVHNQPMHI